MSFLIIGLGGFLGAVARYLVYLGVNSISLGRFPYATLLVNVSGCLVLGIWIGLLRNAFQASNSLSLFLTVGFLGAFTTFSAFGIDTILLFDNGRLNHAFLNVALNVVLCLAAIIFGRFVTDLFFQ